MPCLRIAYAGTPDFSVPALQALIQSGHDVICVITQPDRRAGRGKKLSPSPVKQAALQAGLPILQPENINAAEVLAELKQLNFDLLVVAAFGQLFSSELLSLAKYGCINIHASLLPKWRGASPIQHAILSGDAQTGVSIMQMQRGMDSGDVWLQAACDISADDTSESLHQRLSNLSGSALLEAIDIIVKDDQMPEPQQEDQVTYCAKIVKSDGLVDWSDSAEHILRKLRAYHPWPGIYTFIGDRRVRIVAAKEECIPTLPVDAGVVLDASERGILVSCGINALRIMELVPAGSKRMTAASFANAHPLKGLQLNGH